jgi:type I restriction enzyme R subunit
VTSEEEAGEDDVEQVAEADPAYETQDEGPLPDNPARMQVLSTQDDDTADLIMAQGKRIYVDGVEVYVWNDVHYQLEPDGRTLRLVEYREFVRDRVLSMNLSPTDLRTHWAVAKSRAALRTERKSRAIEPDDLMTKLGHPEADPLDLLINAAWELPLVSRAERALRMPPFTEIGNVIELGGLFGGRDALRGDRRPRKTPVRRRITTVQL